MCRNGSRPSLEVSTSARSFSSRCTILRSTLVIGSSAIGPPVRIAARGAGPGGSRPAGADGVAGRALRGLLQRLLAPPAVVLRVDDHLLGVVAPGPDGVH